MIRFILIILISFFSFKSHAEENPPIKTVVFDFGGVMVDFDLKPVLFYIAKELDMPIDDFKKAIKKEIYLLATGQLSEEDFWSQFTDKYNGSLPKNWSEKYKEFVKSYVTPRKKMYELAQTLKQKEFQVSLFSDVTKWQAGAFQELDLYKEFTPLVLSYEIKTRKPHPESYQELLQTLDQLPSQCLFIDDRIENVQQAQELGIQALQFTSYESLVKELEDLKIL